MKPELRERIERWIAGDPDDATRSELTRLLALEEEAGLEACFEPRLAFGTAGLRGVVGAGPARMNRAVVGRVAWALSQYVRELGLAGRPLVVGCDARPSSRRFAEDTAEILSGQGLTVQLFAEAGPTPLVAFACLALRAAAGVVVTASHNPREDNGYKVYDDRGSQIIAPWDERIAALMDQAPPVVELPKSRASVEHVSTALIDEYFASVLAATQANPNQEHPRSGAGPGPAAERSKLRVAYTPLHGVGLAAARRVLGDSVELCVVSSQAEPDGTFPTTPFPNPEESGVLDALSTLAVRERCDLALANDPDADRLAVCVPEHGAARVHADYRMLSGDEVGVLLADYVLAQLPPDTRRAFTPVIAASVVSSPLIEAVASAAGGRVARTLTGFKWLCRVPEYLADGERFVFAFEEALGYAVLPDLVRDKDGISAASAIVARAYELRARGSSLLGRLHELFVLHGLWVSSPCSVRLSGAGAGERMQRAIEALRTSPPRELAGLPVTGLVDYAAGAEQRPPYLGAQALLTLELGPHGRVLVRPSGTEPKLKLYVHLRTEIGSAADVARGRVELAARGSRVADELVAAAGLR